MTPFALALRWSRAVTAVLGRLPVASLPLLAMGSITAIFAIFGFMLYSTRLDVRRAAFTASRNLAAAVSQDIQREFEVLDMSLQDLQDGASLPEVMVLPYAIRQMVLFDKAETSRGPGALMLLDATGHVVEQAGVASPIPLDLSAEDFFQVHKAHPHAGVFVSKPFVSLVDGETSIAMSRRVERGGVFVGVALGTIRLSHIKDLFTRLELGANGSISLVADDGTLIMRQPFFQATAGASPISVAMHEEVRGRTSGAFEADSSVDGVRRQYFFSRVGTLPLVQFVGCSLKDVYLAWWYRTAGMALAIFLLGNTILLLVLALHGELRRRHAAEAELAVLASTDGLTGVANRRAFDEAFIREWRNARTAGTSLGMLLLDIDHFKALNDAIGHQGGDNVLAALGACLRTLAIGCTDLVARYGGEEFVLLLPGAGITEAMATAEYLHAAVLALAQPHPTAAAGLTTVSIGLAAIKPMDGVEAADLLRSADLALYEAKRAGRNRIAIGAEALAA